MKTAHYELWDLVTANLVATFTTEAEALAFVHDALEDGQRALIEEWALGWNNGGAEGAQLAAGPDLVRRALGQADAAAQSAS